MQDNNLIELDSELEMTIETDFEADTIDLELETEPKERPRAPRTQAQRATFMAKQTAGKQLQVFDTMVPGRDLSAYITSVNGIAILTSDEEKELANQYYYEENVDAARKLVLAHLRFVVHVAKTYSGYGLSEADLIQEGNVGLMKAVKRFNPEVGVRLVSFAVHWIKAEIHEFILRNWRIVKVATTKAQRKLFFNLRGAKKRLGWLTQSEVEVVAKDLGVDAATVTQMEGRLGAFDASFDGAADADDEEYGQAPAFYLEDTRFDPARNVETDNWDKTSTDGLYVALSALVERSRDILNQRWLNDNKATLHELAAKYNVSAERIRQLEKNAMDKVKAVLEA